MRRLLLVLSDLDFFWSHRLPLAKGAAVAGWEVHLAAPGTQKDKRLAELGFVCHELPDFRRHGALGGLARTLWSLRRLIKKINPDLTSAISLKTAFMTGLAAPKTAPIVATITGLGFLFRSEGIKAKAMRTLLQVPLQRAFGRPNNHAIFQNTDDLNLMIQLRIVAQDRTHLIRGSGVNLDDFKPAPDFPHPSDKVVMAARMVREKGVLEFIEAARMLKKRGVKAEFILAGGAAPFNPNALSEAELAAALVDSDVSAPGYIADMTPLYETANLAVLPSYYGEGIPKSLLEAAACGLPIVTTDHTGCREAVDDKVNGRLVAARDSQGLANAIAELLGDRDQLAAMGRRSREKAVAEFGEAMIVTQTLAVYEEVGLASRD